MIDESRMTRIAKTVAAEDEDFEAEEFDANKFFEETVKKTDWTSKGLSVTDSNDDEITWTLKDDEYESCYILFGSSEDEWGYTVVIGGEEEKQVFKQDIREAWEALNSEIDSVISRMRGFLEEEESEDEIVDGDSAPLGTCAIREVEDDGEFSNRKDNIFSLMYDTHNSATYEATFSPSENCTREELKESVRGIKEDLRNGMPVSRRRSENQIRFQVVNKQDIDYAKSLIQNAGWILAQ